MRILQIYELAPKDNAGAGGIEVAIMETSRELVALGHEVTILTGAKDKPGEFIVDGVRVVCADLHGLMRKTWNGSNLSFKRQMLFPIVVLFRPPGNYDVYHGHIYSSGLVANYLARKYGAIAVNTIHGSYYPVWHKLTNSLAASFFRAWERILAPGLAKTSDIQLHTGDYFAQQVLAWGASKKKIRTIHNGVDIKTFHPSVQPLAVQNIASDKQPMIDRSTPVILTARRLVKKNGIDYLIRAVGLVLEKEECQLLIIGDGVERQHLERLAIELNIREKVHFLGFVPHEQLPPYLALADIAVVPSLVEASSIFMLEAMSMAKPVIATNTGGLPEVLDRSTGMLVEPMNERELADAILELLRNKDKRMQLGMNARGLVEANHSWEKVALQMESIYRQSLVAKNRHD